MKLITLNTWGGALTPPLIDFIAHTSKDTDIYCFQEVYKDATGKFGYNPRNYEVYADIVNALPGHAPYFHPHHFDGWGLGMFIKKTLKPNEVVDHFVFGERGTSPADAKDIAKNVQAAQFKSGKKHFAAVNFHGLWTGTGKDDVPERIAQSNNIIEFLKTLSGEIILAGDFNLNPDTESIAVIERSGLRNLIREFGITDTRTSLYNKSGRYADYVFVTPGVKVKNFKVRPEEVSDHAALELEFDI